MKHNTGNKFMDELLDFLSECPDDVCPVCGCDNLVLDDNGEYEFYFCTNMDPECGWESEPGEYGLDVHNEEEDDC